MNFNEIIHTDSRFNFNVEEPAKIINRLAKRAADYIVSIDPEIDFCDAKESIATEALQHLVERIRALPTPKSLLVWGNEPVDFRIDITVDVANPAAYTLTITNLCGKTDTWSLEIQEFISGDKEHIALRKLMKEYGFRTPTSPSRKYRVMLMGKEAIITNQELCRLEKTLVESGSLARPLFEPISEE